MVYGYLLANLGGALCLAGAHNLLFISGLAIGIGGFILFGRGLMINHAQPK